MYHHPAQHRPGVHIGIYTTWCKQGHGGYTNLPPPVHGRGGYPRHTANRPPMRAAPPEADPELCHRFSAVDVDRSGSIDLTELHSALVNGNGTKFDLCTAKVLMNIFDTDQSGKICFHEFQRLWRYIKEWQGVFKHFDRDHSGSIDRHELSAALSNSFGNKLSPMIISLVKHKYAPGPVAGYDPAPYVTLDRFLRACAAVKTLTKAFESVEIDKDGLIQINYEEFMKMALRAP